MREQRARRNISTPSGSRKNEWDDSVAAYQYLGLVEIRRRHLLWDQVVLAQYEMHVVDVVVPAGVLVRVPDFSVIHDVEVKEISGVAGNLHQLFAGQIRWVSHVSSFVVSDFVEGVHVAFAVEPV